MSNGASGLWQAKHVTFNSKNLIGILIVIGLVNGRVILNVTVNLIAMGLLNVNVMDIAMFIAIRITKSFSKQFATCFAACPSPLWRLSECIGLGWARGWRGLKYTKTELRWLWLFNLNFRPLFPCCSEWRAKVWIEPNFDIDFTQLHLQLNLQSVTLF